MYTYNLFALVCIHSRCLCTRLCNIGVLFHLYIYVYTSLTTGLHMSALVCVGPRTRLHVCTWHHLFPCTCACLHLVSLIFTYFCLAPLVFNMCHLFLFVCTCLHLVSLIFTCFCLVPLVSVCLHLSVVFFNVSSILACVYLHSFPLICACLYIRVHSTFDTPFDIHDNDDDNDTTTTI